jgi:hypothetical protein
MKKLFLLLLFSACSYGSKPVTMDAFYSVDSASTEKQVVQTLGEPHQVTKLSDGSLQYEYYERIRIGNRTAETRRYVFVLKDGIVVSKHVDQASPPPYWFDSYQMQTTQNEDNS